MTPKIGMYSGLFRYVVVGVMLFFTILTVVPSFAHAAVGINPQIPFTGVLNDTRGRPITGSRDMVFRIYDAPTGGTVLWEGKYTSANGNAVSFDDGSFSVMLGSGAGNAITLDFNSDTYYLGVTIGSDSEMTPRERMGAVGYAFNANFLDGFDATAFARRSDAFSFETATSGTLLSVKQTGAGDILTLSNTSAEVFTVLESGKVGIGSTSPSALLTVAGNAFIGGDIRGTGTLTLSSLSSGVLVVNDAGVVSATTTILTSYLHGDVVLISEIDSLAKIEALAQTTNILTESDINTSNELASLIDDETGTGTIMFSNAPTISNPTILCTDCITNAMVSDTLTASSLTSMLVSQFTNDVAYITDGNIGWDNTFGFITDDTVVPKNHFSNSGTLGFTWSDEEISDNITATSVPALGITGTTLPSGIVTSSLTTLGTVSAGVWEGSVIGTSFLHADVILASEVDSLAKIEALAGVSNILIENDIDASSELASLIDDETGDGSLVFSNSPAITGTATFDVVETTGTLTAFSFENTNDSANNFAGSLNVTSGDASSFGGDIEIADGSGLALAGGNGIRILQDSSSSGSNDIVFELMGDALSNEYANITTSHALWLTPNNADNCSAGCEPSLVLGTDGKASLYNTGHGDAGDRYFEINFTSGVKIPTGDLEVTESIRSTELSGGGIIALAADDNGNIIPETSDARLKKNITTIDEALDIVLDLRGVRYQWIDTERFGSSTEIGFIAQELQEEIPEVVRDTGEYLSVNSKNITAVLVEAIKEMYIEMQGYFSRTERLEREVDVLRAEIEILKRASQNSADTTVDNEEESVTESIDVSEDADTPVEEVPEEVVEPEVIEDVSIEQI